MKVIKYFVNTSYTITDTKVREAEHQTPALTNTLSDQHILCNTSANSDQMRKNNWVHSLFNFTVVNNDGFSSTSVPSDGVLPC